MLPDMVIMTSAPIAESWWQFLGLVAGEAAAVVGVAALLQRWIQSGSWRRALWQGCTLALGLLILLQISGTDSILASSFARRTSSSQSPPRVNGDANGQDVWLIRTKSPIFSPSVKQPPPGKRESAVAKSPAPVLADGQLYTYAVSDPSLQKPEQADVAGSDDLRSSRVGPPSSASLSPSFQTPRPPGNTSRITDHALRNPRPLTSTRAEGSSILADSPWNTAGTWILGSLWLLGAGVVLARLCLARLLLVLFRRRRQPVREERVCACAARLAQRLGINRPVRLLESKRLSAPMTFGLVRPLIGLPIEFNQRFNPLQQEVILAHELAHLAAHDPAWLMLSDLVGAALWWHPLVWWARHELRAASEASADEASTLIVNGPTALAECLVELGRRQSRPTSLAWIGIGGDGFRSGLGRRVQRLINLGGRSWRPPGRLRCGVVKTAGAMVLLVITIICSAWVAPRAITQDGTMNSIQYGWKHSLAAFALMAAFGGDNPAAPAAEAVNPSAGQPPEAVKPAVTTAQPSEPAAAQTNSPYRMSPEMMRRYGLGRYGPRAAANPAQPVQGRREIQALLDELVLKEVDLPGLPLQEVAKYLDEQARALDPQKRGLNFIISSEPAGSAIDPTTGLPLANAEPGSLKSDPIKFNLPLRNVRLKDVLDAVTAVSKRPIKYVVTDYGVLFAPRLPGEPTEPTTTTELDNTLRFQMSEAMRRRYGLSARPAAEESSSSAAAVSPSKAAIEKKLDQIVIDSTHLPASLGEAAKYLYEQALARDPDKRGLNFVISDSGNAPLQPATIDPNTGLPVTAKQELASTSLTLDLPLRNVRLKDVLDVITKVAARPIKYAVEDYGVVFSQGEAYPSIESVYYGRYGRGRAAEPSAVPVPAPDRKLEARSFRIEPENFARGMERTFGIKVEQIPVATPGGHVQYKIRDAVSQLAENLGVKFRNPSKEVFYNDAGASATGFLMIRAPADDLETLQAAIQTLGGNVVSGRERPDLVELSKP